MGIIKYIQVILIVLLFIAGINAIVFFKTHAEEPIEKIKKQLLIRIDIIMVLTIIMAVLTVLNIIINR